MANWDFVFPYDTVAVKWLAEQRLPHPALRSGNRLPTTAEITNAWRRFDTNQSLLIDDFDWDDDAFVPKDAFKLRGDRLVALCVLVEVCKVCGQLWMYPDTGYPAIIVDSTLDPALAHRLHEEAIASDSDWLPFFERMYGDQVN